MLPNWNNNEEIQIFREYLMIPSIVSDEYDYADCATFIKNQAAKLGLRVKTYYPGGRTKPIIILEWIGTEPDLPKIMLNSHMDVVPVNETEWSYPPFAATIDGKGRIIARGSQDMKICGAQYLAAIRALKREKVKLKRTVLVMFVPDQENGGKLGMKLFAPTDEFKALNIGFVLDEGTPSSSKDFNVFYGERAAWHLKFKVSGVPGHGSSMMKGTAAEKVRYLIDKFMNFRATELKRLEYQYTNLNLGDVTSINLTMINGGTRNNVIPSEISLCFDCRLTGKVNQAKFEEEINEWMEEAGGGIELIYDLKEPHVKPTVLEKNPYWEAFQDAFAELNLKIVRQICPVSTDSRYLREVGIPAIGFTALNCTPLLLHSPNEFVGAEQYLKGIEIWKKIIFHVANA